MSSFGVLHQGVPSPATLTGTDATAQAARIRRQLDRLAPLPHTLLVMAYAPQTLKCSCGARCCSGSYPNPEWADAMRTVPQMTGLHHAIVANSPTRTKETTVSVTQWCGVDRHTVAAHVSIIEVDPTGTRQTPGRFDHACTRVDAVLREAGIVADETRAQVA